MDTMEDSSNHGPFAAAQCQFHTRDHDSFTTVNRICAVLITQVDSTSSWPTDCVSPANTTRPKQVKGNGHEALSTSQGLVALVRRALLRG